MLNPKCPNCSYVLILLERRGRYKCSSCGKLFYKKEIDNRSFRIWNKKQREIEGHNLKLEIYRGRPKLPEEERKRRLKEYRLRYYYKNKEKILKSQAEYKKRNIAHERERARIWREKHRDRFNATKRKYWANNKERLNKKKKLLRLQHYDRWKLNDRIESLRKKQKTLALHYFENDIYTTPSDEIFDSVATFSLSQLLSE